MSHKCQSILRAPSGRLLAQVASVSADFADGHIIHEHSHPEHQLLFASQGVMTLRTRQELWVVPPLRAVWIPAHTPHCVAMTGQVSLRTLYFLPGLCNKFAEKCLVLNVSPLLRELIVHACAFKRLHRRSSAERHLIEVLLDQLQEVESAPLQLPQPSDSRALRVVASLSANPADPRPLETLCRDCGASKRTIQRLFLAETKMTFARWRQQFRLLRALQLLSSGEKVTAAALESGYGSTSAFIAMFRKQLGATPTRYFDVDFGKRVGHSGGGSR